MVLKVYEYRIYPTRKQEEQIQLNFNSVRWVYNKCLEVRMQHYNEHKNLLSKYKLCNMLVEWKKSEETKWLSNASAAALQQAIFDLDVAYNAFFKQHFNHPKFKQKKSHRNSYRLPQWCKIDNENNKIFIPKLRWVDCRIDRYINYELRSVTIKQVPSGKYFVSCLFDDGQELPPKKEIHEKTTLGVDLGISTLVILSNGVKYENIKINKKYKDKLANLQRSFSRKKNGSKNKEKARIKVARVYEKISNCNKDYIHKITTQMINENQVNTYCLETLNIEGLKKNHRIASAIQNASLFKLREMMQYKAERAGKNILFIGQFEPSSKLCHNCGYIKKDLTLNDREWTCPICGTTLDRDVNAAINIKNIALNNCNLKYTRLGKSEELVDGLFNKQTVEARKN